MVMRPKQPGQKKRKHKFVRHNWYRFPRLGMAWRYPKGHHSKVRQGRKSRPPMPNAGYGSPAIARGLVRGMKPVLISNHMDLHKVNSKAGEAAVIASSLGKKKVLLIAAEAEKRGIKILNHRAVSAAQHFAKMMQKKKEEAKLPKDEKKEHKAGAKHEEKKEAHHEKIKADAKAPEMPKAESKMHAAAHHAHDEKGKK